MGGGKIKEEKEKDVGCGSSRSTTYVSVLSPPRILSLLLLLLLVPSSVEKIIGPTHTHTKKNGREVMITKCYMISTMSTISRGAGGERERPEMK